MQSLRFFDSITIKKLYFLYILLYLFYNKIHTTRCNPYKQRISLIFEDVHIPRIWRNFAPSLMIVCIGVKDPL